MNPKEISDLQAQVQRLTQAVGVLADASSVMEHLLNLTSLTDRSRDNSLQGLAMLKGVRETISDVVLKIEKIQNSI